MRLPTSKLVAHLQRSHGIEPGTIFDPGLHQEVPALCFGPLPEPNRLVSEGQHMRPDPDQLSTNSGDSLAS